MTTATATRPRGTEVATDHGPHFPGRAVRGVAVPHGNPWARAAGRAGPHRAAGRAATRRPRRRDRRRATLALLAVVAVALLAARLTPGADAIEPAAAAVVVVAEGETVWDVALPHTPAGTDPAVYVAEVVAVNDLDPRAIPPGTVVRLP